MTKVIISAFIIVLVLYGIFELWAYWDKISNDKITEQKQAQISVIVPEQLDGLPRQYEPLLKAAQDHGATGLKEWLKTYGKIVEDPRKAWIQLDYVVLISREDPAGARKLFAEVKNRTPANFPIYPRIKQLEKTYQ